MKNRKRLRDSLLIVIVIIAITISFFFNKAKILLELSFTFLSITIYLFDYLFIVDFNVIFKYYFNIIGLCIDRNYDETFINSYFCDLLLNFNAILESLNRL